MAYFREFLGEDTILITGEAADLLVLAKRLRVLEDPASQPIPIHALPFVTAQGGLQLTAHPVGQDLVLRLRENAGGLLCFDWQYSEDGWLEVVEKIEHLATSGKAGHNWMNGDYADDAVVMVSRGEYDDCRWENAYSRQARG
ncbi:MAG TPA: hypothetical protein PLL20_02520 [Phycisphaerae bacterium]|nr:hypothetical protein [Phycisphaerae bacterium]HRR83388.1 hypothetical protein [Phycisphaerae bacterium]